MAAFKINGTNRVSCESTVQLQVLKLLTVGCLHSSPRKPSETSTCASFCWFVPKRRCWFKLPTPWQAWTHRNWFHLAVGSPWQLGSLTPHHPLMMNLLGSSIVFPSILLISTQILSDQLLCPGTWPGLHSECNNCFFHLDVSTTSSLKVDAIVIQSGSVCHGETSLVRAFVDEAFKGESQWVWGISTCWCLMVCMHLCVCVGDYSVGRFEYFRLTLSTLDWGRQGGKSQDNERKK